MESRSSKAISKSRIGSAFLLCISIVLLCKFTANSENLIITVGVYENPPKIFTDSSGKPSGIFIDILEHIATEERWQVQYRHGTWSEGLARLEKGEIDIMPDVAYTSDRAAVFDFHKEPVLSSWFQVYARKDSGIRSILDLAGRRITVLEGSVQQAAFEQLAKSFQLEVHLLSLPDYKAVLDKVVSGEADAVIVNRFFGMIYADQYGLEDTAVIFHPSALFFAARKGINPSVLNTFDQHIKNLKKNPQSPYYESLKRWTAQKVTYEIPQWIKTAGLLLGVGLVLSLFYGALLKRQVDSRTRELQEINREMEARIQKRTAELAEATEKAKKADQLKSAFLASMSHELRTPLNSIIGFTGILLQGLAGPLNDEQRKQLGMVQNSARHLLALINDVLDISKIEAGELKLSPHEFDLRQSLQKVFQMVAPMAEKKGLGMSLEVGEGVSHVVLDQRRLELLYGQSARNMPAVSHVVLDQRRLEQILLNLLNNAVKFTEKGSIKVSCICDGDECMVSVSDTGIGIKPEDIPTLFQPFHQIDTGLARKHEGTGLGLSICKKLISMMGGTIHVSSRWGEGSTFIIRFPKVQVQEPTDEQNIAHH